MTPRKTLQLNSWLRQGDIVVVAEFDGMRAWAPGSEIIECLDTVLGNVDLHNECDFSEVVVSSGGRGPTVSLRFAKIGDSPAERFALVFHEVRGLHVTSREAEYPADQSLFHAVEYVESRSSAPSFSVETEVLVISFRGSKVLFEAIV